jgi:hypothetical protein
VGQRHTARSPEAPLRRLGIALALAAVGSIGALGSVGVIWGAADPVALLLWISLSSVACGYLAGALGAGLVPYGVVAPATWMVVLVALAGVSERDVPTPFWAALVWTGFFAGGAGLGRLGRRRGAAAAWSGAGWLLLLSALLVALPARGACSGRPWPPRTASALLDLSPASLVLESAGIDWMRHPAVYDPVGTDRFERAPYRGTLAGPLVLLVGCVLAAGCYGRERSLRTEPARDRP